MQLLSKKMGFTHRGNPIVVWGLGLGVFCGDVDSYKKMEMKSTLALYHGL